MTILSRIETLIESNPDIFEGLNNTHREAFMRWLPDNIHVVNAFGKYALELKETGNREYYSAYAIRERLRWDSMIRENGTQYKISNNITPFVARLIMKMNSRLHGIFKVKQMAKY